MKYQEVVNALGLRLFRKRDSAAQFGPALASQRFRSEKKAPAAAGAVDKSTVRTLNMRRRAIRYWHIVRCAAESLHEPIPELESSQPLQPAEICLGGLVLRIELQGMFESLTGRRLVSGVNLEHP